MRLLIYIEPTSYLMPLWQEIKLHSNGPSRIVFLEENLTQDWGINTQNDPDVVVLRGGRISKLKRVLQLIGQRDVELVHLAGWGHPLLLAAMVAACLHRIPVTMESDTPLPVGLPLWKRAVKRLLYPLLFRLPSRFLPGGSRQAAYLRHYGVADQRISVAQMTVDVEAITRHVDCVNGARRVKICRDLGLPDEATVFLYVGRMEPYKGLQELIGAFDCLHADKGSPVALLLVGNGSMRDMLDRAAASDPRIRWPGRLSGTALLDAYTAADVFVLPSRFESWGLAVNEAMAACLPVIATDRVGCVDDLVHEGVNGRIVPATSVKDLAEAMRTFVGQPEMIARMGQMSRHMIGSWSIEDEARIMISAWDELA